MLIKRDQEEIEAIRKLIKSGATFEGPDGDPLVEEAALQKLLMLNPNMAFGVRRQEKDERDFKAGIIVVPRLPLVDLRKYASPVEDQGTIGSCFAQAAVGCLELEDLKDGRYVDKSRLFLFYNTHKLAGTLNNDCGATIRETCKALHKFGICDESLWPYDIKKCWDKPPRKCYKQAKAFKVKAYKSLPRGSVDQARAYMAQGYPILFGMVVYDYFMTADMALRGVLKMPGKYEKDRGGHAVDLVGYDDKKQMFICRNSWSSYWGAKGYFYMPYEYYRDYTFDPWCIEL